MAITGCFDLKLIGRFVIFKKTERNKIPNIPLKTKICSSDASVDKPFISAS